MIDPECVDLCKAINKLKGIKTISSCCGHGKTHFTIWMKITEPSDLPFLLYYLDECHVNFNWDCLVNTDCAMSPVTFRIESRSLGKQAYKEAKRIAKELNDNK